jgi:Helicase conserved C-terminal domain
MKPSSCTGLVAICFIAAIESVTSPTSVASIVVLDQSFVPLDSSNVGFGIDRDAARTFGVLLATDAASEGIDLQYHCCRVIHYEIPWNPNRLEQRNGRIDRHGQERRPRA